MYDPERLLVLYNPRAGGGRGGAFAGRLGQRSPAFAGARLLSVSSVADALEALATVSPSAVVAVGGDGTVNLVATALVQQGAAPATPLGVLPLGTGNAFAAGIGIRSMHDAIRAVESPCPVKVDVMLTTHPAAPLALVSISSGFEAHFIRRYARHRDEWTRVGAGLAAGLAVIGRSRCGTRLVVDGCELLGAADDAFNAGLYNLPCYGFGATIWRDAETTDGFGEAVVCRARRHYLQVLIRGLHTTHPCDTDDPRWARWRQATFEAADVLQADGELLPPAAFEVRMASGALRVLSAEPGPLARDLQGDHDACR